MLSFFAIATMMLYLLTRSMKTWAITTAVLMGFDGLLSIALFGFHPVVLFSFACAGLWAWVASQSTNG